jgi:hypothetical protein
MEPEAQLKRHAMNMYESILYLYDTSLFISSVFLRRSVPTPLKYKLFSMNMMDRSR